MLTATHHVATGTMFLDGDVVNHNVWRELMGEHNAADPVHDQATTYPRSRDVVDASKLRPKLEAEGKVLPKGHDSKPEKS